MRKMLCAVVSAVLLVACGGGGSGSGTCDGANTTPVSLDPDYAPNFVGTWFGTGEMVLDGDSEPIGGLLEISRVGANKLRFTDGPFALVTSASSADLVCYWERGGADCGSIKITYTDGTVTLDETGNVLDLYTSLVAEGCGLTLYGYMQVTDAVPFGAPALVAEGASAPASVSLTQAVAQRVAAKLSR